jgi:hypothetical protein
MIGMVLQTILPGLFNLGDQLIEDKDKKAEYAFKVQQMYFDMAVKLLDTKTYPWIDGVVKLAYASTAIVKGLIRPVGSLGAMVFVAYCSINGIELSDTIETIMVALLPAWGVSRYKEKMSKKDEDTNDIGW